MSANITSLHTIPINWLLPIIGRQITSDKNFVDVQHYNNYTAQTDTKTKQYKHTVITNTHHYLNTLPISG